MCAHILLTGGAGYIGSHTFVALRAAGHEPVILDSFANARADIPARLELLTGAPVAVIRADVRDRAALDAAFAAHRFDAVVHFAALKAVGESATRPLDYIATNVGGLLVLLEAMRAAGVRRLVYSSSATVYAAQSAPPFAEDGPRGTASTYGWTKLAGEQILEQVAAGEPGWAIGCLRYFNPAGAHDSGLIGEDPNDIPNNLMPYIARVATGDLPHLRIFGTDWPTPDGTGLRDYIHVVDLAEGHVRSLEALLRTGQGHTLNLGTGRAHSVREVLAAYGRACGRALPAEEAPRRAGDVAASWADPRRAAELIGFRARRDLDAMCRSSWNWISRRDNARPAG
jgi:UDP-glucose 4-epimerase